MTWEFLSTAYPGIVAARRRLVEQVHQILGQAGAGWVPTDDVSGYELYAAILLDQICKIEEQYLQVLAASRRWVFVATVQRNGQLTKVFKNSAGQMAKVPDGFFSSFVTGRSLAADLSPDPADSGSVLLVRAGKIEARFPVSLLDHLVALRDGAAGAGQQQPDDA